MISKDVKLVIILSAVLGAVAGMAAAMLVSLYINSSSIAVANIQEIVASYPKVQELQIEQRAKMENLAAFVKNANEKIDKEKSDKIKKELEDRYVSELALQKEEFEKEYIKKLAEVSNELSAIISAEAGNKGYNIVLSKDSVIVGGKDVTSILIEAIK